MKAIGYIQSLPPSDPNSLFDFELPAPTPGPRDLLVAVRAVSVNPIDTKVRMRAQGTPEQPKILGFDCAGVVQSVGPEVTSLQARRRGLLRRLHPPSRHQLRAPPGR